MGTGAAPDPNALTGIIDLIEMKALTFDVESKGRKITVSEIPEDFVLVADEWRQKLLDAVSLLDDSVMETYLATETIPPDEIRRVLRTATLQGQLQPTFCGASLDYIACSRYSRGDVLPPVRSIGPVRENRARRRRNRGQMSP
jgi:elongation factor G